MRLSNVTRWRRDYAVVNVACGLWSKYDDKTLRLSPAGCEPNDVTNAESIFAGKPAKRMLIDASC